MGQRNVTSSPEGIVIARASPATSRTRPVIRVPFNIQSGSGQPPAAPSWTTDGIGACSDVVAPGLLRNETNQRRNAVMGMTISGRCLRPPQLERVVRLALPVAAMIAA